MARKISQKLIERIRLLRSQGWSLPEIKEKEKIGYGTIYRYVKDVVIKKEYHAIWFGKRGGSIKRKKKQELQAELEAKNIITNLSDIERTIILVVLYWGEGTKSEFGLSNTDPDLIRIFIKGLNNIFKIPISKIKVSVRIYEDLDRRGCLEYWSKITNIPAKDFVSVNVLQGKKKGKLPFGMCRVRVTKGGQLLKLIFALKREIVNKY